MISKSEASPVSPARQVEGGILNAAGTNVPVSAETSTSDNKTDAVPASSGTIDVVAQGELDACEEVIGRTLVNGWVEIGKALKAIRDKELYKGPYGTFDEYLRRRWNVERTYAFRLIKAAEVYENLLPIGNIKLPTAEGQVRPLGRLNPLLQQKAWTMSVRSAGQSVPTAKGVAASVRKVAPRSRAKRVKNSPEEPPTGGNEQNLTTPAPVAAETLHPCRDETATPALNKSSIVSELAQPFFALEGEQVLSGEVGTPQQGEDYEQEPVTGVLLSEPLVTDAPMVVNAPTSSPGTVFQFADNSVVTIDNKEDDIVPGQKLRLILHSCSLNGPRDATRHDVRTLRQRFAMSAAETLNKLGKAFPEEPPERLWQEFCAASRILERDMKWKRSA